MKPAPDPKEIQHFQFKQSSHRQVCEALQTTPLGSSLLAADCKRGLLYIAHENKLTVISASEKTSKSQNLEHNLPAPISRLALSCDFSYLSVTFNSSTAHIYNASSLATQTLELLHEIQFSSSPQSVFAYDLKWNPAIPGTFCTVASDNSIGSFSVKIEQKTTVSIVALEKIQGLEPTCVAWSPKGKQIVVGCKNGNIIQLKPELKIARTIQGPSPSIGEALSIIWISNFQFCAAYSDPNDRRVSVIIIDAPKGETKGICTNYEDITFGMSPSDDVYHPRYYFEHVPEWNIIIAASSCSSEVALLGSCDNGANWEQWQLIDNGRAELPCIGGNETFPVGISIDRSPQELLPWGEETLPQPVPLLHIFGSSGRISSFHMVNLTPNCSTLCSAPWEPTTIAQPLPNRVEIEQPPPEQSTRTSLLPSEISFALHSAATSTPRPKPVEAVHKAPLPSTNLFTEAIKVSLPPQTAPAPALAPTAATPAPAPMVDLKIPKPRAVERIETPQQKVETPVKEAAPQPQEKLVDDGLCLRVYREEQVLFEKELKQKLEKQVWEVGTEDEKQILTSQSRQIEDFLGELKETTSSLASDISYLKALLLQSFAWIEETKSRNSANSSENSQERYDRGKIKELQRLYFNTQSQLIQATKALDMEWADYQSREKSKIKIPSLEFVYQSLKRHGEIIAKEKSLLEGHIKRWKVLARGNTTASLNRSMSKLSLKKAPAVSGMNGNMGIIEMRCRTIASNTKGFSREKQMKLRDVLLQNQPRVIKTINSSPFQDRLEATLSSLASLSPVPTPPKPRVPKPIPERVAATQAHLSPAASQSSPIIPSAPKPQFPAAAPSVPSIPAPVPVPVVQKTVSSSPLASLNSIVAQIGANAGPGAAEGASSNVPKQTLSQPLQFSASPSFSPGFGVLTADKISLGAGLQFGKSSAPQVNVQPAQPSFPKVLNVSFGTPEQKTPENTVSSSASKENNSQKSVLTFGNKETTAQSTTSLFTDSLFKSSGVTITKADQSNSQSQPTTIASGLSISFKDTPPATTQSVFSFANPPAFSTAAATTAAAAAVSTQQGGLNLAGVNAGLTDKPAQVPAPAATSTAPVFGKLTMPTSTMVFDKPQAPISAPTTPTTPAVPVSQQEVKSTVNLPAGTSIEKVPTTAAPAAPLFGASPKITGNIFGGGSGLSSSMFGGQATQAFAPATTLASSFGSPQVSSSSEKPAETPGFGTASPFSQSTTATTTTTASGFGATPTLSAMLNSGMSTLNFGKPPASTGAPTASMFGKSASSPANPSSGSIFGQSPAPPANAPTGSIFGGSAAIPAATSAPGSIFGQAATVSSPTSPGGSIFGQAAAVSPTASSPGSIFGGSAAPAPASTSTGSIFGQSPATPAGGSIFGASTLSQTLTTAPNTPTPGIFGSPPANNNPIFGGMASPSSIFGGNSVQNQPETASIFGNAASPAPFGTPSSPSMFGGAKPAGSVFGAAPSFGSPMGMQSPAAPASPSSAFGGPPAFGSKPVFGSPFGAAKPELASPAFGSQPTFGSPGGFGAAPAMSSPPGIAGNTMGKVFGSSGSTTFESLAGQNGGVTFGSLAQKSPEKPPPPAFSGGSSFSSWR